MKYLWQMISNVFHPILSMVWATLIVIFFSPIAMFPENARWALLVWVALFSFLIPTLLIGVLSAIGVVKHGVALHDRKDRFVPLGIDALCLLCLVFSLMRMGVFGWLIHFYWAAFFVVAACFLINLFWKVSAHAAGNAAITTACFVLYYANPLFVPLILPLGYLILTGLICSIRLYLGRHSFGQVAVGFSVGVIGTLLGMLC